MVLSEKPVSSCCSDEFLPLPWNDNMRGEGFVSAWSDDHVDGKDSRVDLRSWVVGSRINSLQSTPGPSVTSLQDGTFSASGLCRTSAACPDTKRVLAADKTWRSSIAANLSCCQKQLWSISRGKDRDGKMVGRDAAANGCSFE